MGDGQQVSAFVCVENAGRSQMAEGFFRRYTPRGYMTLSAGTKPSRDINPLAIKVMNEVGIDISNQKSKDITEDMIRNSVKIVNMGCMDRISHFVQHYLSPSNRLENRRS